jgi:hypothetical protein
MREGENSPPSYPHLLKNPIRAEGENKYEFAYYGGN